MKLFDGDLIILRSEKTGSSIADKVSHSLQKIPSICVEKDIQARSIYKIILFLDIPQRGSSYQIIQEVTDLIRVTLHPEILVIPLYQEPVESDLVMEVYYYGTDTWEAEYYPVPSGGAVVFSKGGLSLSTGFTWSDGDHCRANSTDAFESLEQLLSSTGYTCSDIIRQWNYIENILDFDGPYQNYQIFNDARSRFYHDQFAVAGYPAATGIGMRSGGLIIEYLACKNSDVKSIPIDNPAQVPAHMYGQDSLKGMPVDEVKSTPKFERGRYLSLQGKEFVFVSGTAAISGEKTAFDKDPGMQTYLTIENIDRLTSKENLENNNIKAVSSTFDYLRIYTKEREDLDRVRQECQRRYGNVPCVWIQADICRNELLVEIEGIILLNQS
jgi:enamine deaminase RidA (YjgF/YER057c/UK114 family)